LQVPVLDLDPLATPDAAQLGAAAPESAGPPRPLYLRAPDAQPQDASQIARR